jgi:toxin ParE1/3/4
LSRNEQSMLLVEWTDEAKLDLLETIDFISERNEIAAFDLHSRIDRAVEHLCGHPYLYKPSLKIPGVRELVAHPNYIVYYQVSSKVEILSVVHVRRQHPL